MVMVGVRVGVVELVVVRVMKMVRSTCVYIYINNTSNFMDLVVCPNPVGFQLSQWDTQHVVLDVAFCSWDASVAVLARMLVVAQCGLSWRAALACAPAASVAMEERTLVTVHLAVQRG